MEKLLPEPKKEPKGAIFDNVWDEDNRPPGDKILSPRRKHRPPNHSELKTETKPPRTEII
jgi:hypothetical protein